MDRITSPTERIIAQPSPVAKAPHEIDKLLSSSLEVKQPDALLESHRQLISVVEATKPLLELLRAYSDLGGKDADAVLKTVDMVLSESRWWHR